MEGTSWDANQKNIEIHFQFIKDPWNISAIWTRAVMQERRRRHKAELGYQDAGDWSDS